MKIGDNVTIMVGEPWDFESPMGSNKVTGIICDHTITKHGDAYLMKSDEVFDMESIKIQYMVITHRYTKPDFRNFNLSYIPDNYITRFNNLDIINDKLKFSIIGSVI